MTSQTAWQSQNPSVVSVDAAGQATGRSHGESVVTARTAGRTVTSEIVVVPTGTFRLSVVALEAGVVAFDVRVEVTDGTGTGQMDSTPIRGRYDLYGVAGDVGIRASGAGYRDHIQRVVVSDHTVIGVEMVPSQPRTAISGSYAMTLEADPGCREPLPSDLRRRQYTATVTQSGPELRVTLHGADFSIRNGTGNGFVGSMTADSARVVFDLDDFDDSFYSYFYSNPDVVESLGDSTNLAIVGEAVTTVSPSALAGTLDGSIRLFQYRQRVTWIAECRSTRHPFVLNR
jgi:hypothetical protein